jgi:hypothetical protein
MVRRTFTDGGLFEKVVALLVSDWNPRPDPYDANAGFIGNFTLSNKIS